MLTPLPIDAVLPELQATLRHTPSVVLTAPPGSGKTTRVPLALLDEPWLESRRIIMLEPRRLAARAAAAYMAKLLGEGVGETVGYRIRMDSRVSARTRIEVVTEGVLTRMLQDDPSLEHVGLLIFDEFHERSIHADLGLALSLQSRQLLRPDLRILVMSATLEAGAIAALLDDAPVIHGEGRMYPVATEYAASRVDGFIEPAVASTVVRAVREHDGDILVFLPGTAEIRRTAERLQSAGLPPHVDVLPLYGDLPQDAQDRAIAPSVAGRRKVVLATSIAETSLTIEGVRVVIDSGLMRTPRFSPRTGMTRLVTTPVSQASAEQRRGRAGRVAPGVCFRLWTEADHAALLAQRPPEILEADLAPLALDLAAWGVDDPADLRWLDTPPAAAFAQARELLRELDALDDAGRITAHGRRMADVALHPRLAHMLVAAAQVGLSEHAADIAALLSERDILRAFDGNADPDLRVRIAVVHGSAAPHGHSIDRGALQRVRAESRNWRRHAAARASGVPAHGDDDAGLLLAFAYPDRIGMQRGARGRFVLRNGRGAAIDAAHNLAGEEFIVAAEVGGQGRDSRVFLGAPIQRATIEQHFAEQIRTERAVTFDPDTGRVRAEERASLGALVLQQRPLRNVDREELTRAMTAAVRVHGLELLNWTGDAVEFRQRLAFLHAQHPDAWPDVSDEALTADLDEWLAPFLASEMASNALRRVDLVEALSARVGWERRRMLDSLAPTHVEVPSGSRIRIDYSDPAAPVLAVRLQEMFGLADTPRIADGRVPLTLHLLSPAQRPVQVTRDLASFWRTAYFDVRRDLRGRYPKHYWPENPLEAEATRRTRPRRDA